MDAEYSAHFRRMVYAVATGKGGKFGSLAGRNGSA